jgi:hypothetical protein
VRVRSKIVPAVGNARLAQAATQTGRRCKWSLFSFMISEAHSAGAIYTIPREHERKPEVQIPPQQHRL